MQQMQGQLLFFIFNKREKPANIDVPVVLLQ